MDENHKFLMAWSSEKNIIIINTENKTIKINYDDDSILEGVPFH